MSYTGSTPHHIKVLDITEGTVQAGDPANKAIVGHISQRSIQLMLFTTKVNAQWAADKFIKGAAYPLASLDFVANRNVFRYQTGDNFKYTSKRLGISDMIFRVQKIVEDDLQKETIRIAAIEDIEYISTAGTYSVIPTGNVPISTKGLLNILKYTAFVEALYTESGNDILIIPLVARETGQEQGFLVYVSFDEESYMKVANTDTFAVRGVVTSYYPSDTLAMDDDVGFQVRITEGASQLLTTTRIDLFGTKNLSILGSNSEAEVITWQTITPISGDIYEITGVYRNRYGSNRKTHYPGTEFWYVDQNYITIDNSEFTYGSNLFFKVIPYAGAKILSLSEAYVNEITLLGVSRRPYDPTNFGCNGLYVDVVYTQHCVLTWSPRVRGEGFGIGNPDYAVENPSHEGLFEVEVWVDDVLVRTQSAIDTDTWTYTSTMNGEDNVALADVIVFKLRNYLTYEGIEYSSSQVLLTVNKE